MTKNFPISANSSLNWAASSKKMRTNLKPLKRECCWGYVNSHIITWKLKDFCFHSVIYICISLCVHIEISLPLYPYLLFYLCSLLSCLVYVEKLKWIFFFLGYMWVLYAIERRLCTKIILLPLKSLKGNKKGKWVCTCESKFSIRSHPISNWININIYLSYGIVATHLELFGALCLAVKNFSTHVWTGKKLYIFFCGFLFGISLTYVEFRDGRGKIEITF